MRTVADFEGPWKDPNWESGLIDRCRTYWSTPIGDLPDVALATFVNQRIGIEPIVEEARRRIEAKLSDGSEMYDGQLAEALKRFSTQ